MTEHDLSNWFYGHVCGCGNPEDVAGVFLDVLRLCRRFEDGRWEKMNTLLPGRLCMVALNYMDKVGLLEHGGNIRGSWLTERGEEVLAGLEEHGADPNEWGQHCLGSSTGRCACGAKVPPT